MAPWMHWPSPTGTLSVCFCGGARCRRGRTRHTHHTAAPRASALHASATRSTSPPRCARQAPWPPLGSATARPSGARDGQRELQTFFSSTADLFEFLGRILGCLSSLQFLFLDQWSNILTSSVRFLGMVAGTGANRFTWFGGRKTSW